MTQSKQSALPAGFRLDDYTIVRELSAGGFSLVYLALDHHDRKFAIKEYLPLDMTCRQPGGEVTIIDELDREAFRIGLKCFFEEARVLAGIRHPNIVRVVNFFRANNTVYMVMEYAEGRPLSKELTLAAGHLPEVRLRKLFAELIGGLREVHQQQLLHLDIKPANIYLRRNGSPVLLDFGAARQALRRPGQAPAAMFTPGYAAPEQYDAKAKLGPWTDIYGLGASLYTMLGGGRPQSADERQQADTLQPASKLFAHYYSPQLLALADACLQLEPQRRPDSLERMQQCLLANDYVTPPPRSLWQKAGTWLAQAAGKKP
ncbi:serine/threonine protein kinase [Vogesella fluminis]|nr:serine/threonine-protein kinase [Vogesella fluminis]